MTKSKTRIMCKKYDLEERTLEFAKNCINLCKSSTRDIISVDLIKQLIRAASSVGANYREANETTTKKDFFYRIGICRREAKESKYWLELLSHANQRLFDKANPLVDEALQLSRIFASIVQAKK